MLGKRGHGPWALSFADTHHQMPAGPIGKTSKTKHERRNSWSGEVNAPEALEGFATRPDQSKQSTARYIRPWTITSYCQTRSARQTTQSRDFLPETLMVSRPGSESLLHERSRHMRYSPNTFAYGQSPCSLLNFKCKKEVVSRGSVVSGETIGGTDLGTTILPAWRIVWPDDIFVDPSDRIVWSVAVWEMCVSW